MANLKAKIAIKAETKKRIRTLYFGHKITNICAGEENPFRHGFFVRYKSQKHLVEITDGKGSFGAIGRGWCRGRV